MTRREHGLLLFVVTLFRNLVLTDVRLTIGVCVYYWLELLFVFSVSHPILMEKGAILLVKRVELK